MWLCTQVHELGWAYKNIRQATKSAHLIGWKWCETEIQTVVHSSSPVQQSSPAVQSTIQSSSPVHQSSPQSSPVVQSSSPVHQSSSQQSSPVVRPAVQSTIQSSSPVHNPVHIPVQWLDKTGYLHYFIFRTRINFTYTTHTYYN